MLSLNDPLVQNLLNIIWGLSILVVALILARLARGWTRRALTRGRISVDVAVLLGNIVQVAVIVVGIISMLPFFGITWAGVVTILGAAGLALSLSMQDLLRNVIAGIYILMEQPFHIGDRITVKDVTGVVQGIQLRITTLITDEKLQVVVPNNVVLNEIVTNRSVSDQQRQIMHVRVKEANLADVSKQIGEILAAQPEVATTPAPVIAIERIVEGAARLRVEYWVPVASKVAISSRVIEGLQTQFPNANVSLVA